MLFKVRCLNSKGKVYRLRCIKCGYTFLSSLSLEAPICDICLQKAKSLDMSIDYDKVCSKCGDKGAIYGKELCQSCYHFEYKTIGDVI